MNLEPRITASDRAHFNALFAQLASLLSFGKVTDEMEMCQEKVETDSFCYFDLKDFPQKFLVGENWSNLLDPLLRLRTQPFHGKKVEAVEVLWLNIYSESFNPFGDTGFFLAQMYSLKPTSQS